MTLADAQRITGKSHDLPTTGWAQRFPLAASRSLAMTCPAVCRFCFPIRFPPGSEIRVQHRTDSRGACQGDATANRADRSKKAPRRAAQLLPPESSIVASFEFSDTAGAGSCAWSGPRMPERRGTTPSRWRRGRWAAAGFGGGGGGKASISACRLRRARHGASLQDRISDTYTYTSSSSERYP